MRRYTLEGSRVHKTRTTAITFRATRRGTRDSLRTCKYRLERNVRRQSPPSLELCNLGELGRLLPRSLTLGSRCQEVERGFHTLEFGRRFLGSATVLWPVGMCPHCCLAVGALDFTE